MRTSKITGDNLGERHRSFNKLVDEAIANKLPFLPTLAENDDLNNMLKIDIASKNRNVDFILEVYKCEDMLLVSRALKRTIWLITDNQYAHIIQPKYLFNELFQHMTARAVNKLLLNIRIHLKNETLAEEFYNHIKIKDKKSALKWLPKCSIPFIENEIGKYKDINIPNQTLHRLFERSFTVFEAYNKTTNRINYNKHLHNIASEDTQKYMDLIETMDLLQCVNLSRKIQKRLMKMFPERIFNKLEDYYSSIDTALIVKYVRERPDLRAIMINKAKDDTIRVNAFFRQNNIRHWIKLLPKENRFEIIKKNIILKEDTVNDDGLINLCAKGVKNQNTVYEMYKYAPFNIAFEDLIKLIRTESAPAERNSILLVLLTAAGDNPKNLETLLEYYFEKHVNTPYKFKIQFINAFISKTNTHAFDDETWETLNKLFQSTEVYMNSEKNVQHCINAIIVRNVIRGIEIPPIVKSKFRFSTLKEYKTKLKHVSEKNAVINFLYNYATKDMDIDNITTKTDFCKSLSSLNKLFEVLIDWNKNLSEYPDILRQIKMLIAINKKNNYGVNLSTLYFANKEWRRSMFDESIALAPSDKILVNAIKHDASMLNRYKKDVVDILCNDNIRLTQILRKIRVFWPDTIAEEFKTLYKEEIHNNKGNKAAVSGFCKLVPHKELQALIEKYVPSEKSIDWNETDERVYNVRKYIASTLYQARPIIPLDFILLFAEGDYLQYTVPSLCAVLSQLSPIRSEQCISKLLKAPVSLQKFAIRYLFMKLNTQQLIPLASKTWSSSKNSSIRKVLVSIIHTRLCQESDESQAMDFWRLLCKFIDDLTCDENNIFDILLNVKNVPHIVRPDYIMKVYRFLDSLPPNIRRDPRKQNINTSYITGIMHLLDDDFVIDCLLKDVLKTKKIKTNLGDMPDIIIASFILCNQDEDTQERRYKKFLAPLLDSCIADSLTKHLLIFITQQFRDMTTALGNNIPYKVFLDIQSQLEKGLSYEQNYIFLTHWKIVVEAMRVFNEFKLNLLKDDKSEGNINPEIKHNVASLLGRFCAKTLKEDVKKFYPSVYTLFAKALIEIRNEYQTAFDENYFNCILIYKYMLENANEADIEIYLTVMTVLKIDDWLNDDEDKSYIKEVQQMLQLHPSPELKMHYYASL